MLGDVYTIQLNVISALIARAQQQANPFYVSPLSMTTDAAIAGYRQAVNTLLQSSQIALALVKSVPRATSAGTIEIYSGSIQNIANSIKDENNVSTAGSDYASALAMAQTSYAAVRQDVIAYEGPMPAPTAPIAPSVTPPPPSPPALPPPAAPFTASVAPSTSGAAILATVVVIGAVAAIVYRRRR